MPPTPNPDQLRSTALKNERYDAETIEVMRRLLHPDSACVDAGAHAGSFLAEMQMQAPKGQHYAIEPLPHLAASLRKCYPSAHVFECALGDKPIQATFQFVRNDPGYSGLLRRTYDRPDPEIEEIIVDVARLDDLIPDHVNVSFIKLDIEGGEYHAMRGGRKTIERSQPVIVFEAGENSSSHYGVTPQLLYSLVVSDFGFSLSTMERWLNNQRPFSSREFFASYASEFYFIAYPPSDSLAAAP